MPHAFFIYIPSIDLVYNGDNLMYNYDTSVNRGFAMTKYDQMEELLKLNKGYLFSSLVEKEGISRTYLARFIKDRNLEKVAKGVYITEDTWNDSLFVLQHSNPKIVFSGETALYLNQLMEREYSDIVVSVPEGHNGARLRERGVIVHQEKEAVFGLGVTEVETNYGNIVRAYNSERCICDLVRLRSKYEAQTYKSAIKTYMRRKDKNLTRLIQYAETLKIRDEIDKYVEVMT